MQNALKRDMLVGLARDALATIPLPLKETSGDEIVISNFAFIGSYNWKEREQPTIIVPGSPRIWRQSHAQVPFTVENDKEFQIADHNGHRFPAAPLLPILLVVPSSFDWTTVDYVMDRNSLRKLLGWIKGVKEGFRIDCEIIGHTILCSRWEERTRMAANRESYGVGLVERLTELAPGCEGSAEGNHRIVTYNMGGIMLVVRFEVDGCILDGEQTSIHADDGTAPSSESAEVTILHGGAVVPDSSIIEISSKKQGVPGSWRKRYEQMFFAQTPTVYVGTHTNGKFTLLTKKTMRELDYVRQNMQPNLRQLCAAMTDIRNRLLAAQNTRGRVSLVCKDHELKLYEVVEREASLPEKYNALFQDMAK
ncbi:hypothetical protein BDZ89DRAFT_1077357 [Hymenopellis radicata]|nr:hypothetical protein BDZ89DRAFT_1077357 [Hymenopellis radicata]